MTVSSTLIRSARLVPVGRPTPTDLPVDIRIDGATVTEVPLLVQEEVPLAGILGRAWDSIRLWIK